LLPGALLRYAVTAQDANGGQLARKPTQVDTDGQARRKRSMRRENLCALRWRCSRSSLRAPRQRVFKGLVVNWRKLDAESRVPVLHWFVAEPEKAMWDDPVPGMMAFDGDGRGMRFYDRVRPHSSAAARTASQQARWARSAAHRHGTAAAGRRLQHSDPRGAGGARQVKVHRQGSGRHDGNVKLVNDAMKSKDWPKARCTVVRCIRAWQRATQQHILR
jgi:hypothetical protein